MSYDDDYDDYPEDEYMGRKGKITGERDKKGQRKFSFRRILGSLEGVFNEASAVADTLHKTFKEPSIWNFAKLGFEMANKLQNQFLINYYEYFQGWTTPYSEDYNYAIVEILKRLPYKEHATQDANMSLREIEAGGVQMFYAINIEHESIEGIHVRQEDAEQAREFIRKAFWNEFGHQFLLMHKKRVFEHGREVGEFLVFDADDDMNSQMTKRGRQIADKTKRFLDGGVSRSILLFGPPGTGKSTMVRAIVKNLNLRSLRIRVEDLEDLTNTTIFEAIKIFDPECVIIDDMDRCSRLTHMLEMLEKFNKKLKVVFATVNDKDSLGDAVLRPGRFDELIEIKEMDEETVKQILAPDDKLDELYEILRDWPIAYILEFVKRRKYMGRDAALEDLAELHHRVRCLTGYDEDEDVGSFRVKQSPKYQDLIRRIKQLSGNGITPSAAAETIRNYRRQEAAEAKVAEAVATPKKKRNRKRRAMKVETKSVSDQSAGSTGGLVGDGPVILHDVGPEPELDEEPQAVGAR